MPNQLNIPGVWLESESRRPELPLRFKIVRSCAVSFVLILGLKLWFFEQYYSSINPTSYQNDVRESEYTSFFNKYHSAEAFYLSALLIYLIFILWNKIKALCHDEKLLAVTLCALGFITIFTFYLSLSTFLVEFAYPQESGSEISGRDIAGGWLHRNHLKGTTGIDLLASSCGIIIGLVATYILQRKTDLENLAMQRQVDSIASATSLLTTASSNITKQINTTNSELSKETKFIQGQNLEMKTQVSNIASATDQLTSASSEITKQISTTYSQLSEKSKLIQGQIEELISDSKRLIVVREYDNALNRISAMIEHSEKEDTDLFILNPTASFGYFLTFDADVITSNRFVDIRKMSPAAYTAKWREKRDQKEKNFDLLRRNKRVGKIHYATLRGKSMENQPVPKKGAKIKSAIEEHPFITSFISPIIDQGNTHVHYIKPNEAQNAFPSEFAKIERLFILPDNALKIDVTGDHGHYENKKKLGGKDLLKDYLNWNHNCRIESLTKASVGVYELDFVPIQIFLSASSREGESQCLIVFSNQYTIGRTTSLIGFFTHDDKIISLFKEMWHAIKIEHASGKSSSN